jgi:hypothetical protein
MANPAYPMNEKIADDSTGLILMRSKFRQITFGDKLLHLGCV